MELVKSMVEAEKIPYRATLKTNASIAEVVTLCDAAYLIVVDENFDGMSLLNDKKISLKGLMDKISKPINIVPK